MLETMRRMQEVQIVMEARIVSLSPATFAKVHPLCPHLKTDGSIILNELESLGLLRAAEADPVTKVMRCPKMTHFAGQSVSFSMKLTGDFKAFNTVDFRIYSQLAFDLQQMDLKTKVRVGKVELVKRMHEGWRYAGAI